MSNEKLAQKLRELRKVNNYTQDYVAEVLGVVRQTYSHYETGKRTPDTNALYKLAGLYNISMTLPTRKNICLTPILNVNYYSTLIRYPNRIRRKL